MDGIQQNWVFCNIRNICETEEDIPFYSYMSHIHIYIIVHSSKKNIKTICKSEFLKLYKQGILKIC